MRRQVYSGYFLLNNLEIMHAISYIVKSFPSVYIAYG